MDKVLKYSEPPSYKGPGPDPPPYTDRPILLLKKPSRCRSPRRRRRHPRRQRTRRNPMRVRTRPWTQVRRPSWSFKNLRENIILRREDSLRPRLCLFGIHKRVMVFRDLWRRCRIAVWFPRDLWGWGLLLWELRLRGHLEGLWSKMGIFLRYVFLSFS